MATVAHSAMTAITTAIIIPLQPVARLFLKTSFFLRYCLKPGRERLTPL